MKTITTMVNQLKRKFPSRNISIDKHHNFYRFMDKVGTHYTLFCGEYSCEINLSYDGLNKEVNRLLGEG